MLVVRVKGIMLRTCAHTKGAFSADFFVAVSPCFLPFIFPYYGAPPRVGGGAVILLFGWGCAAGILEPLAYTRATVSVKIVGTFLCVLLPSMLVYTICPLNHNKQHWKGKGKHGKGKKAFALTVPTIFV